MKMLNRFNLLDFFVKTIIAAEANAVSVKWRIVVPCESMYLTFWPLTL